MYYEVNSNSLGTNVEITAVMPIRMGTVNKRRTVSYATRLRLLLYTFNQLRKTALESNLVRAWPGPTEVIQALHAVRWMLIEQDTKLLLAVDFDSAWEPYIRRIVEVGGPILDVILCHCEGYDEHATDLGYDRFAQWVRNYQEECEFYYSASPDLTVDDIWYLRRFKGEQGVVSAAEFDQRAANMTAYTPQQVAQAVASQNKDAYDEQFLLALQAFYRLHDMFADTGKGKHAVFLWRAARRALGEFEYLAEVPEKYRPRYAAELAWAQCEPAHHGLRRPEVATKEVPLTEIEADLQANVMNSLQGMTHGCVVMLKVVDPGAFAKWLARVKLTPGTEPAECEDQAYVNLALTYQGLIALGVPKDELALFPKEFREGMHQRGGPLGDVGVNHADHWQLPRQILSHEHEPVYGHRLHWGSIDLVVNCQIRSRHSDARDHLWHSGHPLYGFVTENLHVAGCVEVVGVEPLRRPYLPADQLARGHFGLLDGISNPKASQNPSELDRDAVALGELLLGHGNDKGDNINVMPGQLLYNGTFLVARKLQQHADHFRDFIAHAQHQTGLTADVLVAKMLGRTADGKPLVPGDLPAGSNDFDYQQDRNGELCPIHSHIRRAHPRGHSPSSEAPRIFRRGFMYGPQDQACDDERGLVFMAYNASIAEQFEVVQRWCAQGNSTGAFSGDADPLLGVARPGRPRVLRFLQDGQPHRVDMNWRKDGQSFVTLRWGLYCFVPAFSGLEQIKRYAAKAQARQAGIDRYDYGIGKQRHGSLADYGRRVAKQIPRNRDLWKIALEDGSARGAGIAEGLWSAIDAGSGAKRTPFGILVSNPRLVQQVLENADNNYSARMYWHRLVEAGVGDGYIGMDQQPQAQTDVDEDLPELDRAYRQAVPEGRYHHEAAEFNERIFAADEAFGFDAAYASASRFLAAQLDATQAFVGDAVDVEMEDLIDHVLADLSHQWFGVPLAADDDAAVRDFSALAGYIFNPHPTDYLEAEGKSAGATLRSQGARYVQQQAAGQCHAAIAGDLYEKLCTGKQPKFNDADFTRTLVGVAQGFSGPTRSTFLSAFVTLKSTETLWRLQLDLHNHLQSQHGPVSLAQAEAVLLTTLKAAMQRRPVPEIVYRKAVRDCRLGRIRIKAGDLVTVSLRRASALDFNMLFGGDYAGEGAQTSHPCPGRRVSMGTLLGCLAAILVAGPLVPRESALVLGIQTL